MKRLAFAVPGDLQTVTGGYGYDRRIIAELQRLGWEVDVVPLGDDFPKPNAATKAAARERLLAVPAGVPVVVDGLALGVLPELAAELRDRNPLLALVHHPLAFETGLSPEQASALRDSEREALAAARGVIVTSAATAMLLNEDYDVPAEAVTVVIPGTDPADVQSHRSGDGTVRLLAVGAIVPRKGYGTLIEALAPLVGLPWRLTIAGDVTRDPNEATRIATAAAALGPKARIAILGAVPAEQLRTLYAEADLFVLPSRFEGYGMAFAEALAFGVPVIGTTAGALADTVPPDAGILVEPNDVDGLTRALRLMIENPAERQWLAGGARTAGEALPRWDAQALLFAEAIEAQALEGQA